jgi:hypothetical protein
MFLITWAALLKLDHIEKTSSNRVYAYATFSLFVSIFLFVILATIYRFENITLEKECLKNEFCFRQNESWFA